MKMKRWFLLSKGPHVAQNGKKPGALIFIWILHFKVGAVKKYLPDIDCFNMIVN